MLTLQTQGRMLTNPAHTTHRAPSPSSQQAIVEPESFHARSVSTKRKRFSPTTDATAGWNQFSCAGHAKKTQDIAEIQKNFNTEAIAKSLTFNLGLTREESALEREILPSLTFEGNTSACLTFDTPFRTFSISIDLTKGRFKGNLKLKLDDDSASKRRQSHWQFDDGSNRRCELPFFVNRAAHETLEYLGLSQNPWSYYGGGQTHDCNASELTQLRDQDIGHLNNIQLTLDNIDIDQNALNLGPCDSMLARVVSNDPVMGHIYQLAPVEIADGKPVLLVAGAQKGLAITEIVRTNLETGQLESIMKEPQTFGNMSEAHIPTFGLVDTETYSYLDKKDCQTTIGPMVRVSDLSTRFNFSRLYCGDFKKTTGDETENTRIKLNFYQEMATIGNLIRPRQGESATERLKNRVFSSEGQESFMRTRMSKLELKQLEQLYLQGAFNHSIRGDTDTRELLFGDKSRMKNTARIVGQLMNTLAGPEYQNKVTMAVNMCCPANTLSSIGAGAGFPSVNSESGHLTYEDQVAGLIEGLTETGQETVPVKVLPAHYLESSKPDAKTLNAQVREQLNLLSNWPKADNLSNKLVVTFQDSFRNHSRLLRTTKKLRPKQIQGQTSWATSKQRSRMEPSANRHTARVNNGHEQMIARTIMGSHHYLTGRKFSDLEAARYAMSLAILNARSQAGSGNYGEGIARLQINQHLRFIEDPNLREALYEATSNTALPTLAHKMDKIIGEYCQKHPEDVTDENSFQANFDPCGTLPGRKPENVLDQYV